MQTRFALPVLTAIVAMSSALLPATSSAQLPFSIEVHDSSLTLREGQLVDMKATITNQTFAPIDVRAVRFHNDLPGMLWYTAICFGEQCFPPDMDMPPPARIEAGSSVTFKLTVGTEETNYTLEQVRAGIRFDTGEGTEGVSQEFVVTFDATSSAIGDTRAAHGAARPNPARTVTTLPFDVAGAGSARVQLVNALGRTVVDLHNATIDSDGVRLDVSSVSDGTYFYRVDANGATRTGRVVVIR